MGDSNALPRTPLPAAKETMHLSLDASFEDAVLYVQLEHELVGFETVKVTRLDKSIAGALEEKVPRVALVVVCHAEIARDAIAIDPTLAGLLPCTTIVYEIPNDDRVHVYHVSVTKAIRDLGCAPPETETKVEELVELTSEHMTTVWENIEANASVIR